MIPVLNIKTIISKLSDEIGSIIIRADQQGKHPKYPYITYKEITSNEENPYQDIIEKEENSIDPTLIDIKRYEKSEAIISFNFLDKNRTDRTYVLATNTLRWFKSISGIEFCKNNNIIVRMINTIIQDRTIYQEAFFENKIGFDVRFDYTGLYIETVEAIEDLIIGVTRDNIQQDDITINIP